MYRWDFAKVIRNRYSRKPKRVFRYKFGTAEFDRPYKSIQFAAQENEIPYSTIRKALETGQEINGFIFEYQ